MLGLVYITLGAVCAVTCSPILEAQEHSFHAHIASARDVEWLSLQRPRRVTYPQGFQFMYVGSDGRIVEHHKPSTGLWIEVVGSPQASHQAMYQAALDVSKMLQHTPSQIFATLASRGGCGVGVFTAAEKLTVFPEYARYADTPACRGRCDGSCSHTCTFDGRKYESLAGVGGIRALISEDNVLCTARDTYHHHNNILVHEFAHTIMNYGLSSAEKSQITAAYNHAETNHVWNVQSYSMANSKEYFAQGTGAFFLVNLDRGTIGGMISCQGHTCRTEAEARSLLKAHDPQLFSILSHVYTNGHPNVDSGLGVCPA